jgi:hypothetical protein
MLHDPNNSVEWIGALVWLIPVVTIPEPDYRHRQIRLKRGLVVVQDFGQQGPAGPYYDPQKSFLQSLPNGCRVRSAGGDGDLRAGVHCRRIGGRDGINSGAFEGTITDLYMRNKG